MDPLSKDREAMKGSDPTSRGPAGLVPGPGAVITGSLKSVSSATPARVIEVAKRPPLPRVAPPGQEYVDPYLFETGHFKDREEYEELSRTAKIKPRARA